jgi:hypothetical protein
MGQKAHDSTVIPLCQLAHRQRTDFSGPFRDWDQPKMRDFLAGRVLQTQRTMIARGFAVPSREVTFAAICDLHSALAEDLREVGNVDVRKPDAAPLPVARVVSEGDHR